MQSISSLPPPCLTRPAFSFYGPKKNMGSLEPACAEHALAGMWSPQAIAETLRSPRDHERPGVARNPPMQRTLVCPGAFKGRERKTKRRQANETTGLLCFCSPQELSLSSDRPSPCLHGQKPDLQDNRSLSFLFPP